MINRYILDICENLERKYNAEITSLCGFTYMRDDSPLSYSKRHE